MSIIRFFLSIVRPIKADVYSTLFTRSNQKTRPGSTREISYVSLFLKKLMFKEIPLVFLFKVNRASSTSCVILFEQTLKKKKISNL
jgi:hypothetical protein